MSTALDTLPARTTGHAIRPLSDVVDVIKNLDQLWELSNILLKSRMIPISIGSPEAGVAIILKGRELGIGPMHSFDSIAVIQGKPTISPQLMLALIERSGQLEDIAVEEQPEACHITMKRRGRSAQRVTFDKGEASSMGLWGKGNWAKMPGVMLYWRCVAKSCRRVFPDVIAGCYTPDEMGADTGEDGEIVDVEAKPAPKFADNGSGHGNGSYGTPAQVKASRKLIADVGKEESEKWVDAWVSSNRALPNGLTEYPVASATIARIMLMAAIGQGKLQPVEMTADPSTGEEIPRASIDQTHQMIALVADREPQWFQATLRGAFSQEMARVANLFVADNPSYSLPPEYEVFDDDPAAEDESQDPEPPPAPAAPKRMTKKELAEKVRADLEAKAKATAIANETFDKVHDRHGDPECPEDRGDAYEGE